MTIVYKYFSDIEYSNKFLNMGEVYFNSLSYFLSCEDKARRDIFEGSNLYRPAQGLEITKNLHETFLDQRTLVSKLKRPERVFVFCTSTELSELLFKQFNAVSCIEIFNLEAFEQRLKKALRNRIRMGTIKNPTLLSDAVDYYSHENVPGTRNACPDKIIMSKLEDPFSSEKEYRFAFAKDKNAFDVNNLDYLLTHQIQPFVGKHANQVLTLGNLSDICRMVNMQL